MSEEKKNVNFYGKVAKFPKNTKAAKAFSWLESIKIPKRKLWYFIIEKEQIINGDTVEELQIIKYNNKQGVNCAQFVEALKQHYCKNEKLLEAVKMLKIDGSDKFSIIKNIPDLEIDGKKFISILTEDLIRLLYE